MVLMVFAVPCWWSRKDRVMALTQLAVEKATTKAVPYKLVDGLGLYLLVQTSGSKLWRWNYRYGGKQQTMTFGGYPDTSLREARVQHTNARTTLHQGKNPMELRKSEKELRHVEQVKNVVATPAGI